uniref:Cyclic nucleotide-binding domain-containing protein n=1 Tax=Guillardia theta TaxID=55529 RepID=A0A7S4L597_GUITH|mmetsp:Transcript_37765/g.119307  ORF Transcript_37765/g.119307 Transcript_37765/m.119307 type:complete len:220 (+) Transcript_37765:154-813(+)
MSDQGTVGVSKKEKVKQYLEASILPFLSQALTKLCAEEPSDPFEWLGRYLIENNPRATRKFDHKEALVLKLAQGDFFGEIALLHGKPRQATVKVRQLQTNTQEYFHLVVDTAHSLLDHLLFWFFLAMLSTAFAEVSSTFCKEILESTRMWSLWKRSRRSIWTTTAESRRKKIMRSPRRLPSTCGGEEEIPSTWPRLRLRMIGDLRNFPRRTRNVIEYTK